MSQLTAGDEALHYSDSSHRWIAPPDIAQDVWEAGLRAHMDAHRAGAGMAPAPANLRTLARERAS